MKHDEAVRFRAEQRLYGAVWADMVADHQPRAFYGVDGLFFKLDDTIFEAVEDPDDGYRSLWGFPRPVPDDGYIFFREPVDMVRIIESPLPGLEGWLLVSVRDGHVWLALGTDVTEDYYPSFTFRYTPRGPK